MSAVEQIEAAIRGLSLAERIAFRRWFAEFDAEDWDRQLESDVAGGRLDWLLEGTPGSPSRPHDRAMNHRATPRFWSCYRRLPAEVQQQADRDYQLLRQDPRHPSIARPRSIWHCGERSVTL